MNYVHGNVSRTGARGCSHDWQSVRFKKEEEQEEEEEEEEKGGVSVEEANERERGRAHPFVDVAVLELDETGADGGDVRLLIAEGHPTGALRIFQFRIDVDSGVAHAAVQPVHDQRQFHCPP